MNCYVGLAKRLVNSRFPPVIPVPQLEPLDARNIIKQEVQHISTNQACFALSDTHERIFKPKPISEEEAWEATLAWAEAKAQEREAAATKAASQTDTDESYDSDDSEFGVSVQPVRRTKCLFEYEHDHEDDDIEEFARSMWEQIAVGIAIWGAEKRAATIIQAAARGRAVRAWKAQFTNELALLASIYRDTYRDREIAAFDAAIKQHLAKKWAASPKYVKAWIKLAERRRYGNHY
jgi:hypothetical protein